MQIVVTHSRLARPRVLNAPTWGLLTGLLAAGLPLLLLVIDGSQLKRFDSSSPGVLRACRRMAETWGKRFKLRELPPQLRELPQLFGVDEILAATQATAVKPV